MGKGGGGTQTVTQVQEIPQFLQNQLRDTYRFAQGIQPAVFAGDRVAGFTPLEQQAQSMIAQRAAAGDPTVQQAQGLLGNIISGETATNPFLQTQIDNAISGAVNQATSQYALGGRLGSGAFGSALGAGITGAAAPILAQQVERDANRQLQAARMAPAFAQQQLRDLAILQGVGQDQRAMQQAQIQAQQDFINELNAAQQQQLANRTSAAGLNPAPSGFTRTGPSNAPSPLASAAGGALTGAALGGVAGQAGFGGALGLGAGPFGALVGAGLGLLGGL